MKLTKKIALTIAVAICLVLGVDGYLRVKKQLALLEGDIKRDHLAMGRTAAVAMTETWLAEGQSAAERLILRISKRAKKFDVQWIPLDLPPVGAPTPDPPLVVRQIIQAGRETSVVEQSPDGGRLVRTYIPVVPRGVAAGALVISEPMVEDKAFVRATVIRTIVTTTTMVFVCVAATFILGFVFVGRPVRKLVDKARRIGRGDFLGPLNFRQKDEIAELAVEMNTMANRLNEARKEIEVETRARLETLEQLRHADRLKTVGQLTSGVVHEIGTPLTVIAGRARMIAKGEVKEDDARDSARVVIEQTERVTQIVRQILEFARRSEKKKTREDLSLMARNMTSLLNPVAVKQGVYLEWRGGDAQAAAYIEKSQIQQILANLIMNAIAATQAGGHVFVSVTPTTTPHPDEPRSTPDNFWMLEIRDEGSGMESDVLAHIFEPFFTTKTSGQGTGLGLAISKELVREHGGWISVTSEIGQGSSFQVFLPREG